MRRPPSHAAPAAGPYPRAWLAQSGGCAYPVLLTGSATVVHAVTGEVLALYDSGRLPGERLAVRCGNRRTTVCPACAALHAGDTYHLVRAGLDGGRVAPAVVAGHPRLFVTLTAPSFGPVHRASSTGPCRARRGVCAHGRSRGCPLRHSPADSSVGQPVCAECYDYPGHVLWHATVGDLWARTMRGIRRHLAAAAGIPRARLREHVTVSFAKVAEYQRRGAVHLHAVIRLDGPAGPGEAPPAWASEDLLAIAIGAAVPAASVRTPYAPGVGEHVCRWGGQFDIRRICAVSDVNPSGVAAYLAKYVSKGVAESAGGSDRRVKSLADLHARRVTPHVRALMATCWRLGGLPELAALRLRTWAHTLGFRGHVLTKSRAYSTTYGALRTRRRSYRAGHPAPPGVPTINVSAWRYVGSAHVPALLPDVSSEGASWPRHLTPMSPDDGGPPGEGGWVGNGE